MLMDDNGKPHYSPPSSEDTTDAEEVSIDYVCFETNFYKLTKYIMKENRD